MNVYIQKDGISIYLFYTYMHLCTWGQISSLAQFLDWEDPLEKDKLPTSVFLGFPHSSAGKESTCNAGDLDLILGWEDPLEKGKATHSRFLAGEFMDHLVHVVTKSWTWLSDFHFHFFFIKSSDSKIHRSIVNILKKKSESPKCYCQEILALSFYKQQFRTLASITEI